MGRKAGIWIDHRCAMVVIIKDGDVSTTKVESNVEPRPRMAGGSRSKSPYGPQEVAAEGQCDRRHLAQLSRFYDEVAGHLRGVGCLLLLGPGEAKRELLKSLDASAKQIAVELQTADKLTQRQLVARVREHFGDPPRRMRSRAPA